MVVGIGTQIVIGSVFAGERRLLALRLLLDIDDSNLAPFSSLACWSCTVWVSGWSIKYKRGRPQTAKKQKTQRKSRRVEKQKMAN